MVLTLRDHHLVQLYDVLMPQALQQLDLAHRSNREPVLLLLHPYPLKRDMHPVVCVLRLVHLPERALANLTDDLVQLVGRR